MTTTATSPAASGGARKRDFTSRYAAPDPRPLFAELDALDYRVPQAGAALFRRLVDALGLDGPFLDLCCSYGQDAALLNHDLDLDAVYARYRAAAAEGMPRDALVAADRAFYRTRRRADAVRVVGLDASGPAVDYGVATGLLDVGVVADLEAPAAAPGVAPDLAPLTGVGGIGVTGALSYIGPRTFDAVLDASGGLPWVAGYALRWLDVRPVLDLLRSRGYEVQVAEGRAVVQRRTSDAEDLEAMQRGLAALGRTPTRLEAEGVHAAVPFLAVARGVAAPSLEDLAAGVEDGTGALRRVLPDSSLAARR